MPLLSGPIGPDGPVIDLIVSVSLPRLLALQAAKLPEPRPQLVRALLDTGASNTAVDPRIIQALGFDFPTGFAHVHTPTTGTTPTKCNQYDVSLLLPPPQLHTVTLTIPVIESDLSAHPFEVLIGRDVLDQGLFVYNGPLKWFSLAF